MNGKILAASLALALSAQLSASVIAIAETKLDWRKEAKETRTLARWCAKAAWHKNNLGKVFAHKNANMDQLSEVASRIFEGERGCQQNRALAIAMMEWIVGSDPLTTGRPDDLRSLTWYHDEIGTPQSKSRAKVLRQTMWLRGEVYAGFVNSDLPNWSAEEIRALIASDPVWRYLSYYAGRNVGGHQTSLYENALLDPLSPRHDPAKYVARVEASEHKLSAATAAHYLLDGKYMPRDVARAEALLKWQAPFEDAARALILPLIAPRLESKDTVVRDAAFAQLALYANSGQWGASGPGTDAIRARLMPFYIADLKSADLTKQAKAADILAFYAARKMPGADTALIPWLKKNLWNDPVNRQVAWNNLSWLMREGNAAAAKLLEADMARTHGAVDVGQLTVEHGNLARITTENDYPPSAIRQEEEGIVEASVIIGPDGRIMQGQITRSASPTLDAEWLRVVSRRARKLTFPNTDGRYVKAKLPPVHFKLGACESGSELAKSPPGAIVIVARCPENSIHHAPVPVSTLSSKK